MRLALVTYAVLPQLHEDDQLLVAPLARRGVEVVPAVWDDPAVDWARFDACVIRSTWDYTFKPAAFNAWTERVETVTQVWNPPAILRWNGHKGYLRELADRGAHVVPTAWIADGEPIGLRALAETRGWDEVVVKPCVSGGARDTVRVHAREGQNAVDALRTIGDRRHAGDFMVQPYEPAVEREGEHSLIFLDGEYSHAIRKHPQLVPGAHIGGEPLYTPDEDELAAASKILALVGARLLYARVDLVRDQSGGTMLMELEALEPRLYFATHPPAAERFADAIARLPR